ncbi:unnamed protein product [Eruca vesicaria subsp. sativa]|uniref:ZF-HD dimerization-type domain-containing protein n=1 Tax=Eruca vesicaria subsp. sativa TaxID=29727 RepID=A0ABC8KJB5_ERUVS|nr:unnamed protein product [Eruca vesicaria subsp. sativa]
MLQEPRGCNWRSHARRLRRVHAPTFTSSDRTSLRCAACGCHSKFHDRDPDKFLTHFRRASTISSPSSTTAEIKYQCHTVN